MAPVHPKIPEPLGIGVLGEIAYSVVVLSWMFTRGVYVSPGDLISVLFGLGYSVGGLALMAAVPLYLMARLSLVSSVARRPRSSVPPCIRNCTELISTPSRRL